MDLYYVISFNAESACKTRLELIKLVAVKSLNDLKNKADDVYKDLNDWLGARFLKEIERYSFNRSTQEHIIYKHKLYSILNKQLFKDLVQYISSYVCHLDLKKRLLV